MEINQIKDTIWKEKYSDECKYIYMFDKNNWCQGGVYSWLKGEFKRLAEAMGKLEGSEARWGHLKLVFGYVRFHAKGYWKGWYVGRGIGTSIIILDN